MNLALLDLLREADTLKDLPRAGWLQRGLADVESVAAHSWGVAFLVLTLLPPSMDRLRALSYAVLHDLPEVRVGDLTPRDGVSPDEKATLEHHAATDLLRIRPELLALWQAYEAQADPEARFVRELDRLDMALRAIAYGERSEQPLEEFLDSADAVIQHEALRPLFVALRAIATRA